MNPPAFKDFIVCKALDVISGNGAYRKYLHQCCENGEDWALKVSANVAAVGVVIKDLHALVDRVRRLPNSKLGKVCGEIVSSMHSPVRVIPGWSTCELKFIRSKHFIENNPPPQASSPSARRRTASMCRARRSRTKRSPCTASSSTSRSCCSTRTESST